MIEYCCPIWLPHIGARTAIVKAFSETEAVSKIERYVTAQLEEQEVTLLPEQ